MFGEWIYGSGVDGSFTVAAPRIVTDGVYDSLTTPNVTYVESATANFTAADVGQSVCPVPAHNGVMGEVVPTRITAVLASNKVQINGFVPNANPPVTGLTLRIGGFILVGQYTDVTIPAGVTARMASSSWDAFSGDAVGALLATNILSPVFQCTGSFTIDGTLDLSGANAIGSSGGQSLDLCGGCVGGAGSTTIGGNGGLDVTSNAGTGPGGGAGGAGSAGHGGVGTETGASTEYQWPWMNASTLWINQFLNNLGGNTPTGTSPSATGGGGGGGDGTNSGAGGGEGGQFVLIIARNLIHGPANLYNLQGGNGAPATVGNCGGGGGGGRGFWATLTDSIVGTANIAGVAGVGGAGIGSGTNGAAGSLGPGVLRFSSTG